MEDQNSAGVVVVMVPLPAQGHLNQLLHLTRIISTRGIPVHYVGSATHNRQAKDRVHGWDPSAPSAISNIHFHDFQLPRLAAPPPLDPPVSDNFPLHLIPTLEASSHLREPLGVLLRELSRTNRRVVVVHDSLTAFAAEEASLVSNSEAYYFVACSAFAVIHFVWEALGKPADEEGRLLPTDIQRVSFENSLPEGIMRFTASNSQWLHLCAGIIYDTCKAVEGRFLDFLAQQQPDKKFWEMGPFNPVSFKSSVGTRRHLCLEWLDRQPPRSVIYVSFGTTTSVSEEQIAEIALGLERSGQRFIWVLRHADRGDIYEGEVSKAQVPDGFEEKVKGVGMIVRDWAPQLQILAHLSTGGFMSHCGWNSSLESLSMGVPIAAWPMHSDQPRNAFLLTEVLKVGLMVREWSRRKEVISSDIIESSVTKLMESEEGDMMRKRAHEMGIDVRRAVSEDGTSTIQLESFLAHICR